MPATYVRCVDCGRITRLEPGTLGLSHHCPVTGVIKTVHADGRRVADDEMDPRGLPWPYRPATSANPG